MDTRIERLASPLLLALALAAGQAQAAVFCIENNAQLTNALAIAGLNGQDDALLLTAGVFSAPSGFELIADNAWIDISGGWRTFLGNPCGFQTTDPWLTRIDGEAQRQGLRVVLDASSALTLSNLTFQNGVNPLLAPAGRVSPDGTSAHGGGLEIVSLIGNQSDVTISGAVFIGNFAGNDGGGVFASAGGTFRLVNNLFINNGANNEAGAARFLGPGTAHVVNNTIAYNQAFGSQAIDGLYLAGSGGIVANTVLWGNGQIGGRDLMLAAPGFVLLHNTYGSLWGIAPDPDSAGNTSVDPLFAGGCGNPRLRPDSPLIEAGIEPETGADWTLAATDLDGHPRIAGAMVDIGAFELETIFRDGFEGPSPCPAPL